MVAPIPQLRQHEILWLYRNHCKAHGHRYIEHYACYEREQHQAERVGFLDIEASHLKADFGLLLSYCIKPKGEKEILYGLITREDLHNPDVLDKRIVAKCINDLKGFQRVVGHYSTKYDLPFLRTRALIHKLKFPTYGEVNHTDVYYLAKRLLCLHSNRQNIITEALFGKSSKTRIDPHRWVLATIHGDEKALAYVLDHNKKDAIELEKNYNKLIAFSKKTNKSI